MKLPKNVIHSSSIHEDITKLKMDKINTLNYEYNIFRMKPGGNIHDMEKRCIHILNNLRTLGINFLNEDQ